MGEGKGMLGRGGEAKGREGEWEGGKARGKMLLGLEGSEGNCICQVREVRGEEGREMGGGGKGEERATPANQSGKGYTPCQDKGKGFKVL